MDAGSNPLGEEPMSVVADSETGIAPFWSRANALEMNAYLLTHPETDLPSWFESRVEGRKQELSKADP
jgi:hypothetical protein